MIKQNLLVAALVAVSITLSSCGGNGMVMFRGDASHSGRMNDSGPTSLNALAWKYTLTDKAYSSAIADGKNVYLGCNDGFLYVLDQNTGGVHDVQVLVLGLGE